MLKQMSLEGMMLSKISQTQRDKCFLCLDRFLIVLVVIKKYSRIMKHSFHFILFWLG